MEEDRQKLLNALKESKGKVDEIELGEKLGFNSEYTEKIIQELLKDGKIEFQSFGICSYKAIE